MKWKESSVQFEKVPAGNYLARCFAVIDLGTQLHKGFQGAEDRLQRDVRLSFELPTEKMEGIYDEKVKGKPFAVHANCKQSLHIKANLRKLLEGWRGKKFTAESIETFDPKKLVGLPCRLTLVENGDYTNIDSISPLSSVEDKKTKKKVPESCPKQINPSMFFSLDEFDPEVFKKLGKKTQEKIQLSPEYKIAIGGGGGEEPQESDNDGGGVQPEGDDNDPWKD